MASNPERLQTLDATFVQRIRSLVSDVEIDLDAALPVDDE
jgi:antitoxin PrlF